MSTPQSYKPNENQTSEEFLPLTTPRIAGANVPAEPVNWFTVLAPRLPEADTGASAAPRAAPLHEDGEDVRRALFPTVEQVAATERERDRVGIQEPPEVLQMRREAAQIARELVENASSRGQKIEEEARERGYQAGFQAGYAAGESDARFTVANQAAAEHKAYREDLAAFIAHIEAERQRAWNEMEPQIISLIFDLAKHVIKQEVEAGRGVVLAVIRNALRRVADSGTLRIRVHASDLETVRERREEILSLVDNVRNVEIIEDRRVGAGGCIVETAGGNIDARLETQLDEIGKTLERIVKGGS